MPLVNTSTKTLQIKIVYYGPGLSGKTTNLEQLNKILAKERVGEMMSLDTTGDRTLFFDWLPLDLGKIRGFDIRIQLYTVPGQVRYNKTRQQVLRGVDGLVFIADSQKAASEQNQYSYNNLRDNLIEMGLDMEELPMVIQCNKKDLPETMTTREIALLLSAEHVPFTESVAHIGKGVSETLRLITRITLKSVQKYLTPKGAKEIDSNKEELDGDSLLERILSDDGVQQEMEPEIEIESANNEPGSVMTNVEISKTIENREDASTTPVAVAISNYMPENKNGVVPPLKDEANVEKGVPSIESASEDKEPSVEIEMEAEPDPSVEIEAEPSEEFKSEPSVEIEAEPSEEFKSEPSVEIEAEPSEEFKPEPSVEIEADPSEEFESESPVEFESESSKFESESSMEIQELESDEMEEIVDTPPINKENRNIQITREAPSQVDSVNEQDGVSVKSELVGSEDVPVSSKETNSSEIQKKELKKESLKRRIEAIEDLFIEEKFRKVDEKLESKPGEQKIINLEQKYLDLQSKIASQEEVIRDLSSNIKELRDLLKQIGSILA
jgi:mutual gliding-motility protein MglA